MSINKPEYIIIHESDSPIDRGDTAKDIHLWHTEKGWDGIGYHYVVLGNGFTEVGRPEYWVGSHCPGYNQRSLGACRMAQGEESNEEQYEGLLNLVKGSMIKYSIPASKVLGHKETKSGKAQGKTCPGMDMDKFRSDLK